MYITKHTHPADDQTALCVPEAVRKDNLYPRCSVTTLGAFAQTSQKIELETAFSRLQSASINAAPEFLNEKENAFALAAIAILKKHPDRLFELLFTKKMVKDHCHREIWASPYQLFLGAGDVWALKQLHEMISLIPDDDVTKSQIQQTAQAQFRQWFPNYDQKLEEGWDEEARLYDDRNKQQIADIVKQLDVVKQLINADPFTDGTPLDVTRHAVAILRQLFQPTPGKVIRSGLHFPLVIMNEIYNSYDGLQKGYSFFSLNVINPALQALSTVDGQCCREGLKKLNMEAGPARSGSSAYRHPLGQPLQVMHTKAEANGTGVAVLVDPCYGDVCFSRGNEQFTWFDKNAALLSVVALQKITSSSFTLGTDLKLDDLCSAKMSALQNLYSNGRSRHARPGM